MKGKYDFNVLTRFAQEGYSVVKLVKHVWDLGVCSNDCLFEGAAPANLTVEGVRYHTPTLPF